MQINYTMRVILVTSLTYGLAIFEVGGGVASVSLFLLEALSESVSSLGQAEKGGSAERIRRARLCP